MIVGHGPSSAKIMFVLDYPTKDELATGIAGTGSCGRVLNEALHSQKATLKDYYITTFAKEHLYIEPKKGKGKTSFRKIEDYAKEFFGQRYEAFERLLFEEINEINPNVIVPMGELALNVLTGEKGIEKFRGSIIKLNFNGGFINRTLNKENHIVVPLEHVRNTFEEHLKLKIMECDLGRILQLKDLKDLPKNDSLVWVCKSASEFDNYTSRNKNPEFATTDIETYLGHITCISFCCDGKEAVSVPLIDFTIPTLELALIWKEVARFLNSGIPFIGHNFKYDLFFLERFGFNIKNVHMCTMLGGHTIYPELPKGLDFYTSIYTTQPYYKDERKEFDPKQHNPQKHRLYNAKDSLVDWIIAKQQLEEMKESRTHHFFFSGPMKWFHLYRQIEANGILVDNTQRQTLLTYYSDELEKTTAELQSIVGKDFNPGSPEQVAKVMYEDMGIPFQKHPKTGEITTEEDTIEFLLLNIVQNTDVRTILNNILYYRKLRGICKFLTFIMHPDGRVRTIYSFMTESGRTSTPKRRAALDQYYYYEGNRIKKQPYGWPFQTIPKRGFRLPNGTEFGKDLTSIFIPTPGYVFCEGDLSQAEARIVALLAEDYELLADFDKAAGYVHKKTASWIFLCDIENIVKGSYQYDIGKKGRHGAGYGLAAPKLARMASIPIKLADNVINTIHQKSPNIRGVYHYKVRQRLTKYGFSITPFCRRRDFFGRLADEGTMREGFSYVPQSTTTDQTKFAMLRIQEKCPWNRILIESHDSIFSEVPEDRKDEYLGVMKKEMEQPIDFNVGTFSIDFKLVIPVEQKWSETNWMEMGDIKT